MPLRKPAAALLAKAKDAYIAGGDKAAAAAVKRPASTIRGWAVEHGWNNERQEAATQAALSIEAPSVLSIAQARIRTLERELRSAQAHAIDVAAVRQGIFGLAAYEPQAPSWQIGAPWHKGRAAGVPVLFLSDWHWGEVVRAVEVHGVNEFNSEIAAKRLRRTVTVATNLLKAHIAPNNYSEIVVLLGGDIVSGDIHEELAVTNDSPLLVAVLDSSEHFIGALRALADAFPRCAIRVVGVAGNHGRLTRKPRFKQYAQTNCDWLIYQLIERALRTDPRFSFDFPPARDITLAIAGKRLRLTHGDQFRGGDGAIGAYGPVRRGELKKRTSASLLPTREHDFDFMAVAHWHNYHVTHSVVMNGAGKGFDEFAMGNGFSYEPAMQALFTIHPEFGMNSAWPIHCEEPQA